MKGGRDSAIDLCLSHLNDMSDSTFTTRIAQYGASLKHLILGACDIVTIAVPPALPAAICIGLEMAMARCRSAARLGLVGDRG